MATFGGVTFKVEVDRGMFPGKSGGDDGPTRYECAVTVSTLIARDQLFALKGKADYRRPLGQTDWIGIIQAGDRHTLTAPLSAQGINKEQEISNNAILTRVESDGSTSIPGKYRLRLTFMLPEIVT